MSRVTQRELKQKLEELVSTYFAGITVVWGKTKAARSLSPLIVLTTGTVSRPYQPIKQMANDVPINYYPSNTTVQVDLYTKGAKTNHSAGIMAAMENTAVSDLTDFVNFLNSDYVDDWCGTHDISILTNQVQDLSQIINDVSWDYRAMVELEIGFTQAAIGHTGMMYESGMPYYENGNPKYDNEGYALDENGQRVVDDDGNALPPGLNQYESTPSGGGTQELADQFTGWYERVETKYELEEKSNDK